MGWGALVRLLKCKVHLREIRVQELEGKPGIQWKGRLGV